MKQVIIENPIINSPFEEPRQRFRFSEEGNTDEIVEGRRPSSFFVPIPKPKKKGKKYAPETEGTEDRVKENEFVNQVRESVSRWRQRGYPNVTRTTARLLEYWTDPDRERKLFFCQVEALETLIYVTEVASKDGAAWIESKLRERTEAGTLAKSILTRGQGRPRRTKKPRSQPPETSGYRL